MYNIFVRPRGEPGTVAILTVGQQGGTLAVMQHYRLYHVSPTGRIVSAQDLQCRDDLDALQKAERAREHHNVELWQDIRLLARLKQHAFH